MCDHCHSFTRLRTTYAISFLLSLSTFCPPNNSSPQLLQDSCHLISQCSPLPQDFSAPQPAIYRANSSCVRLRRNSSFICLSDIEKKIIRLFNQFFSDSQKDRCSDTHRIQENPFFENDQLMGEVSQ